MGEDGSALELELAPALGHFHDDVGAEDVGGHQVGRELDAVEGELEHFAERADQERLAQTGHAFEQDVAAGQDRGQSPFDDGVVADHDLADFGAQRRVLFAKGCDALFSLHFLN